MNDIITTPQVTELPKKELCGLTDSQFKRFKFAFWNTYNAIAEDGSYPRSEMIELVCDADRLNMFGEPRYSRTKVSDYPEFYQTIIKPMIETHYGTPAFKKMMKLVI